jgi:hypothetical protein
VRAVARELGADPTVALDTLGDGWAR